MLRWSDHFISFSIASTEGSVTPSDPTPHRVTIDPHRLLQRLSDGDLYSQVIAEVDRIVLPQVLAAFNGHYLKAAAALGISRMTLRKKLRVLGIQTDSERAED